METWMALDMNEFQRSVDRSLPQASPTAALFCIMGRAGALANAHIAEVDVKEKSTIIGELVIHLADYCNRESINLGYAVSSTWWKVQADGPSHQSTS